MRVRALTVLLGGGILFAAGGCGSSSPTAPASFPETSATVQLALNRFTTGTISVPASCGGSILINCPGGTAGSAVSVTLTRSGTTITQTAPDVFSYATDFGVVTQSPIVVSSNGTDCDVSVNTANGTASTVHLEGTATFSRQTVGGAINEIDFTTALTGVEAADVTITGPGACQVLAANLVFVEGVLVSALTSQSTRLCAGAGGTFTTCS
jgi:hypothetical protein